MKGSDMIFSIFYTSDLSKYMEPPYNIGDTIKKKLPFSIVQSECVGGAQDEDPILSFLFASDQIIGKVSFGW